MAGVYDMETKNSNKSESNDPTTEDREAEIARAIHEALKRDQPDAFITPLDRGEPTVIDGHFDLFAVARSVFRAL